MTRTAILLALGILLVPFALLIPAVVFGWIVYKLRHIDLEDASRTDEYDPARGDAERRPEAT